MSFDELDLIIRSLQRIEFGLGFIAGIQLIRWIYDMITKDKK